MHPRTPSCPRRGFTLIELLVVIAILAVLVAITFTVGRSVVAGGKASRTRDAIRVMEQILGDYSTGIDGTPDAVMALPEDIEAKNRGDIGYEEVRWFPVADARWERRDVMINSGALFLAQATADGYGSGIEGIDARFIEFYTPETDSTLAPRESHPQLTTVMDGWGNPIRYVHPEWDGQIVSGTRGTNDPGGFVDVADNDNGYLFDETGLRQSWIADGASQMPIRRNRILESEFASVPAEQRDSDGGVCVNQARPYFYSPGPDGDPATIEDNVYTQDPRFIDIEP
ncbi:MAG: type II secretion system protein [Phycisphaerales bacterium]